MMVFALNVLTAEKNDCAADCVSGKKKVFSLNGRSYNSCKCCNSSDAADTPTICHAPCRKLLDVNVKHGMTASGSFAVNVRKISAVRGSSSDTQNDPADRFDWVERPKSD